MFPLKIEKFIFFFFNISILYLLLLIKKIIFFFEKLSDNLIDLDKCPNPKALELFMSNANIY